MIECLFVSLKVDRLKKDFEEQVGMSAYYSKGLKDLIFTIFKVNSKATPKASEVLASDFVQHFLLEESVRGKHGEHALEQAMGKPFEQYEQQYEEKRLLGRGGMGKVMLVKRKEDH